jgi:hypothetical protein
MSEQIIFLFTFLHSSCHKAFSGIVWLGNAVNRQFCAELLYKLAIDSMKDRYAESRIFPVYANTNPAYGAQMK